MDITIKYADGRRAQRTVRGGTLQLIDLPTGQKAQVTIKLGRGLTLNGRRRVTLNAEGGAAGLILDARGRPIHVPKDISRRSELLPKWYSAVRSGG
jgi:hypothetical protein